MRILADSAAFDADEPFPQVLSHALTRCYTDLGWDTVTADTISGGGQPKYPSLGDLQRTAQHVVTGIGYGKEITDNVRGFIDVRLGSLRLGTPGRFFEGGQNGKSRSKRRADSAFEDLWRQVDDAVSSVVDRTTFADLLRSWTEKHNRFVPNWEI